MAEMKHIYDFAVKWLDKFHDQKINYIELLDHYMADDCEALGYKMDCGNAFSERYEKAFNDYEELEKIIDDVNDIDLLGSAIYSQWRYFNHWAYTGEEILEFKNRSWFILALRRVAMLATENQFIFEDTPRKIHIVSNNICYGPCPEPTDEVEQHITINDKGRVWFSTYTFGEGFGQYKKDRNKNFDIEKSIAVKVLNTMAIFFSQGHDEIFATDIGDWHMELTNTDGKTLKFKGSLCADFEVDGINLSDIIRDALEMDDLYAFDGNCKPDKMNRMRSGCVKKKRFMVNDMASIYLNDILNHNGIDPRRTKLIRHSLKHKRCKCCFDNNFIDEYQKIQSKSFFKDCDYILSFISEPGTSAKFIGCYKVGLGKPIETDFMPKGFPVPEMFSEGLYFFNLTPIEIMADLKERLIIDWGKATVSWHQWATNEKAVLAIQTNPKYAFLGYDKIVLSYTELKEIVKDNILYENWHTALSSVYAIYLIVDKTDGKQYVGSAYGDGGLLGRWKFYIDTKHGGNNQLKEMICNCPERYEHFQFSILQILPKTITQDEVIRTESLYKQKFLTKKFGLNDN